jgi:hypothetical protein
MGMNVLVILNLLLTLLSSHLLLKNRVLIFLIQFIVA